MLHRFSGLDRRGDVLAFCRWSEDQFPLAVSIEGPQIPRALEDEFSPKPAGLYVHAVERALAAWEGALGGLVTFRRAPPSQEATLRIRLIGQMAPTPEPDVAVLGTTPLAGACRAQGFDATGERLLVRYSVPEVRLYVADSFGLLTEDQVERVALHELGHALGMRGHSPIPADLMYEVARDGSLAAALTTEDVRSFVALYRVPNGTVFGRSQAGEIPPAAPAGPPAGAPRLAAEPRQDPRHGFALRLPEGWMQMETPYGVIAIDGLTWDYDASIQVISRGYPSAEAYLARNQDAHIGRGVLRARRERAFGQSRAVQLIVEGRIEETVEEVTVIEAPGSHVLVVIADCPADLYSAYAPWFDAVLRSIELRPPVAHEGA
jgi:predicted Zn-dependent protease